MKTVIWNILISMAICIAVGCATTAKNSAPAPPLRQYQFSDIDSLVQVAPRPIAVFLHADWCKFCQNMKQTTFQNPAVVNLLNEEYYYVSFDGEQKDDIIFNGQLFRFKPTGRNNGTHELASALGTVDGALTYPTFLILNPANEIVFLHNAFINGSEMGTILESALK